MQGTQVAGRATQWAKERAKRANPRSYRDAAKVLAQGRNRDRRKLANNTWLERRQSFVSGVERIAVRLHQTDVVVYRSDGSTKLDSGGWRTVTTKDRINRFGPKGVRVWSDKGEWYVYRTGNTHGCYGVPRKRTPFADGVVIGPRGGVRSGAATAQELRARKILKERIRRYAKLCADSLPLPMPSGGDCWDCSMVTSDGKTLGDRTLDTTHLKSHLTEGYVVPSLVWHALEEAGYDPKRQIWHAVAFRDGLGHWDDRPIRSAVIRYMARRLGLSMKGA